MNRISFFQELQNTPLFDILIISDYNVIGNG